MLCAIFQSNAQSGFTCTLEDANGEVVSTQLIIGNEIQVFPSLCFYQVQLIITALDGMADQDVQIQVQAGGNGGYNAIHTLPAGQQSVAPFGNNVYLQLQCGTVANVQFTVVGNTSSNCLDQAFFPVEFTRFEAKTTANNQVKLIWETASEIDNQGFGIERSQDGYKWETLDFVKGAGNSLEEQYYEWIDDKPYLEQVNYYRLKQIDFDGDTEYSEIIVAKTVNKGKTTLFPNPATDFVTLDLGSEKEIDQIELYNVQGHLVRSIPVQSNTYRQNIITQDLMAGVYWVVIISKNNREQIRLVKQ